MSGDPKCKSSKSGQDRGIAACLESWSGSESQPICNLNAQDGIKHFVRVTNHEIYPVKIECTAEISSNPKKARFHCPKDTTVTEGGWSAKSEADEDGGVCCFQHVHLLSTGLTGSERIATRIIGRWLDQTNDMEIAIRVDT